MFSTKLKASFVVRAILPGLAAKTMLSIVFPVSHVPAAVYELVNSSTMGFVILPASLVDITVSMDESTFATCSIELEIADELRAVFPNLSALAMSLAILVPLPVVDNAVF